ncbi:virA/G regulated protein [Agrobacterium rhizogenes]|uniref:VirA/G regulated protein n=8 Tax=Hyphomicrobiales TaxID=356 RepID=A0A2Z2PDS0_RHIRH|nr:virE3 family protein [Agrobacterium tumefaciens]ASK41147.1 virA/G regulated protein [Rhizobium rhizogenes]ASK43185.1 virA/G regulated protein [Agrobacterium deltaense]ASK46873.1 virA/G regulated protein [Agrobacterium radiobacter]ASK47434.1 virA/G regulated protein [Agrobacterium tomkonis]ASK47554.1 virA/G regulated protein [Agrobacterium fabrum]KAA6481493.1 virA/G regulated protein [Agrobacterium sp. ICMP 7243]MBN7807937.1 virA/G regulated protein [Agrobacterium rosae]MVA53116.1 virA/G 
MIHHLLVSSLENNRRRNARQLLLPSPVRSISWHIPVMVDFSRGRATSLSKDEVLAGPPWVSRKILGVTVGKELKTLSKRELDAQRLRAAERALDKQVWQNPPVNPSRSQRGDANSHLRNERDERLESEMTIAHQAASVSVGEDRQALDAARSTLNELHNSPSSDDRANLSSPRAEICDRTTYPPSPSH